MKAADLATASTIVTRLAEIKAERVALAKVITSAGLRVQDNSATWVKALKPETKAAFVRLLIAERDAEEAALRRRAAQISLSL